MSGTVRSLRSLPPAERAALDAVELGRRFQEGDRRAFEMLVGPELDALFTLCLRVLGRRGDAEEVAQEALERALLAHRQFDPQRPFRVWLFTIAINRCRDRMRGPWWARVLRIEHAPPPTTPSCERLVEQSDADARVRALLSELPPIYREALSLYHLDDLTYEEMSQILGVSEPALKQRVRRGREMLRVELERLYPELGLHRTDGEGAGASSCSDKAGSSKSSR